MNESSYLCSFIRENADWEELLTKEYQINVRREGDLALFKYTLFCDFHDSIVQEARGIILNVNTLEVVCWPFRKFGNYNESYADPIDWSTACVQEKVDGSIIKLWYDRKREQWQFSTNGMIRAEEAFISMEDPISYADVIRHAYNYPDLCLDSLDRNKTYIFELVSPETRVVVPYKETMLYHIGTRNNQTGEESDDAIGICKPRAYSLHSLEECLLAAKKLNEGIEDPAKIKQEGFVVVDGSWNRIKIKSADYLAAHYISGLSLTKEKVIELLRDRKIPSEILTELHPEDAAAIKYYAFRMTELALLADEVGEFARTLYEEYQHDRKLTAEVLKRHKLGKIGFWCLDHKEAGHLFLESLPLSVFSKWIPKYEPVSVRMLFF